MAQTKHEIQAILAEAGSEPRYRFGQNFMIDQNLVRLVAEAARINPDDLVIEVGPGTGTLTEEIVRHGCGVLAVEIDRDLAGILCARFVDHPKFQLLTGDALAGKHALNERLAAAIDAARLGGVAVKLVANLPYNIASPLVIDLLIAGVDLLVFTVQKEVARRLRAAAGSDDYGPLSVVAQMLARVEVLRTLPPQAFWPAPKIESSLVRLTRQNRTGDLAAPFGTFVHQLFSFRRKMLRKAIARAGYPAEELLAAANINGERRPEELSPEEFYALFERGMNAARKPAAQNSMERLADAARRQQADSL